MWRVGGAFEAAEAVVPTAAKRGERAKSSGQTGGLFAVCSLCLQSAEFLLMAESFGLPASRLFAKPHFFVAKLLLARNQARGLQIALDLSGGGPTLNSLFFLD